MPQRDRRAGVDAPLGIRDGAGKRGTHPLVAHDDAVRPDDIDHSTGCRLRHNSTISALNSAVNESRGRGLFPLSVRAMLDIRPGAQPQIRDVRQTGSTPTDSSLLKRPRRADPWSQTGESVPVRAARC